MKAEKLAIWPWLSGPYNEHTLVDLPSSLGWGVIFGLAPQTVSFMIPYEKIKL